MKFSAKVKRVLAVVSAIIIVIPLLVGGVVGAVLYKTLQPLDPTSTVKVQFVIPKGQSVQRIAQRLQEEKLVKNSFAVRYLVWRRNLSAKIQAGSFQLSSAMSPREIVELMTMGTDDRWVTIPEGKRREEVASYFKEFASFDANEFIKLTADDEGYLFPDTYLFPAQASAQFVRNQMRSNFDAVVKKNNLESQLKKNKMSLASVVIMASILEREARSEKDMKIVAGILYNRLQSQMPLQVDATMQYAKGFDEKTQKWWPSALSSDKQSSSPFNTYKVLGLPPSPIANPGLSALNAAAEPTVTEYFFYLTDNEGYMRYSKTYDEHLQNIAKYLR